MENSTGRYNTPPDVPSLNKNFFVLWGQTIPMVTVTLVTLVANGTVILMFIMTKSLRKCKNIYIASLAIADFFIGCTMPASMIESLDTRWSLRHSACKLHLTARYSLLYISMLSILLISIDRWWSIHYPFSYRVRQSRRLAASAVTVIWVLSFGLHIPPIVLWDMLTDTGNYTGKGLCDVPYRTNFVFILCSSLVEYILPLVALWTLNSSIYLKISKRKSIKIRRSLSASDTFFLNYRKSSSESDCNTNPSDESADIFSGNTSRYDVRRNSLILKTGSSTRRHTLANYMTTMRPTASQYARMSVKRRVSFDTVMGGGSYRPCVRKSSVGNLGPRSSLYVRKQSDDLVRDLLSKQDKKAACSLGMLVIVFTICWTPYMVSSILTAQCSTCVRSWLRPLTFWILVTNSAINPFLYGILNAEFRKVLRQWFYCNQSRKYRLKQALLYWNLQQGGDSVLRE